MLYKLIRSLLFKLDPETAHALIMGNIDWAAATDVIRLVCPKPVRAPVTVMESGNPRPRLWRLIPAEGIVNHMGFNNCGADKAIENLNSARPFRARGGILGINIGKQNSTPVENALADYQKCMQKLYAQGDYLAIDISCPNTPGLTRLQEVDALEPLYVEQESLARFGGGEVGD